MYPAAGTDSVPVVEVPIRVPAPHYTEHLFVIGIYTLSGTVSRGSYLAPPRPATVRKTITRSTNHRAGTGSPTRAVTSAGGVLGPIAHDPRLLQAEAAKRADDDAAALQRGTIRKCVNEEGGVTFRLEFDFNQRPVAAGMKGDATHETEDHSG